MNSGGQKSRGIGAVPGNFIRCLQAETPLNLDCASFRTLLLPISYEPGSEYISAFKVISYTGLLNGAYALLLGK